MSFRRILIALAIVLLVPVALVAAAVLIAQSEWAGRWLETRISQQIARDVQTARIDNGLRPRPRNGSHCARLIAQVQPKAP